MDDNTKNSQITGFLIIGLSLLSFSVATFLSREMTMFTIVTTALIVVLGKMAELFINKYFTGKIPYILQISSFRIASGIAALFFIFSFNIEGAKGIEVIFLTTVFTILSIAFSTVELFGKYIVLVKIIKAFIYLFRGIVIKFLSEIIWVNGEWDIGVRLSISNIVLVTYLIMFVITLLSLFELSENKYLKTAGKWFGKNTHSNLVYALLLGTLIIGFDINELLKWITLATILIIIFFVIIYRSNKYYEISSNEQLKKHIQEVNYSKNIEIDRISKCIDEFVIDREKENLIVLIVQIAINLKVPNNGIKVILRPLLSYNDAYASWFNYRSEIELVNQRNIKNRRMIVNNMIAYLDNYRREDNV
jgi:hypothetical protein